MQNNKLKRTVLIVVLYLFLWQAAAFIINNDIVMASPVDAVQSLGVILTDGSFYVIVANSVLRIVLGFVTAFMLGACIALLSYRFSFLEELLSPFFAVIKTVPVASFVVLLLIWSGKDSLSFIICFLIVFPNMYNATLSGFKSTPDCLLKMADIYEYSFIERVMYIYKDASVPYIISNMKVTAGLAWKSGVAAELIGLPEKSIGSMIYMSKIYLDTAGLFAWTTVIVLISVLFEKVIIFLLNRSLEFHPGYLFMGKASKKKNDVYETKDLRFENICVSFGEQEVLRNVNLSLAKGKVYALMGESGTGKTTLLRKVAEMCAQKVSFVFQEDVLIEKCDAYTNVMAGKRAPKKEKALEVIKAILPENIDNKKACDFSGGMRRRLSLIKALLSDGSLLLLDEPFTGLDEGNTDNIIRFINENQKGRIVLFTTHNIDDAAKMCAEVINLEDING